jgi:hypothetical protein
MAIESENSSHFFGVGHTMRILFFIMLAASVGGYVFVMKKLKQHEPIFYGQTRLTMQMQNRDFELVATGERYGEEDCQALVTDWTYELLTKVCNTDGVSCSNMKYRCDPDVDAKYFDMLDKHPDRTHFFHAERRDDLRGVFLYWGLTAEESLLVCNMALQQIKAMKLENLREAQCI